MVEQNYILFLYSFFKKTCNVVIIQRLHHIGKKQFKPIQYFYLILFDF